MYKIISLLSWQMNFQQLLPKSSILSKTLIIISNVENSCVASYFYRKLKQTCVCVCVQKN